MKKSYEKHMEKKKMLAGKRIVGIDPAKEKHQATVLDEEGMQRGKSLRISLTVPYLDCMVARSSPSNGAPRASPTWVPSKLPTNLLSKRM